MAGALGVFARSEAEVESQGDQVDDLTSFVIGGEDAAATMEWTMPSGTAMCYLIRDSSRQ